MSDLIDRQALRTAHGLGSDCHDCKRDMKSCQYDRDYSLMDFCEWLDDAPAASPWHRVEEDPPNGKEDAIFCYEWTGISGTVYRETSIVSLGELIALGCRPIAWMEKPEPPKEDA